MHSHLQHSLELQRRRRVLNHAIPLLPCLHKSLLGSVSDLQLLEFHSEDLLHPELTLYHIFDDANLCADEGKGEGVEVRRRVFGWECGFGAVRDDDF